MNQSQKQSLTNNEQLRKEYTEKMCQILNKYLPEDAQFTQEKIDSFINDKTYLNNYNNFQAVKQEMDEKRDSTKLHVESSVKDNDKGCRFTYLMLNNGKTEDQQIENFQTKLKTTNDIMLADLANDYINNILSCDIENYFPDSDKESIDFMTNDMSNAIGGFLFTNNDLIGRIAKDNPELATLCDNFEAVYQGNVNNANEKFYSHPLSLVIPQNAEHADELLAAIMQADKELRDVVEELSEKTTDFKDYTKLQNIEKNKFIGDFNNTLIIKNSYLPTKENAASENIILKNLVDKGIITKNTIFEKQFKLGDNIIPAKEAFKHIDPTTLEFKDGLKFEPIPEETRQKIKDNGTVLKMKSNALYNKELLANINTGSLNQNYATLKGHLEEMAKKMDDLNKNIEKLTKDNPDKAKDIERAEFVKLNNDPSYKELKDTIANESKGLNKELAVKQANREKQYYQNLKENNITKDQFKALSKKESYASLASKSTSLFASMTSGGSEASYYSDKHKELADKFGKDSIYNRLNKMFIRKLNDTSVKDSIKTIAMMNQKDEEYKNRGRIGKWWYRKSHDAMMQQKEAMTKFLTKNGVPLNVTTLGSKEESLSFSEIYNSYSYNIDTKVNDFNKKIDTMYQKYIGNPLAHKEALKNELPELSNKLKENEQVMKDARKEFVEYYKKEGINKEAIPNFDETKYASYRDNFKKWLDDPSKADLKKFYNEAKENYTQTKERVDEINVTTDAIDKSFKTGVPYYPIKQDNKVTKAIKEDIKKDEKEKVVNKDLQKDKAKVVEKSVSK